ncbi:hypothetical protein [Limoniibacter endophyticus]|uniref:Uncharacterized protein n=1 Tax=Limoniibacter endophyticus TaxID=1565040 RepID=A0A8J3DLS2_9HYPH|nr:hypothetical protein [Limoniibacter endophyticus]GHC68671.1 hypothetical protein GCM10010136_13610 [Limoniibacter endophyticus]
MDRKKYYKFYDLIEPGDILLKSVSTNLNNRLTHAAQFFGKGPAHIVHAGIASSSGSIIETGGNGLGESAIVNIGKAETYDVFRCKMPEVAWEAYNVAQELVDKFGFNRERKITYRASGHKGSKLSIWNRKKSSGISIEYKMHSKLNYSSGASLFCSEFVVLCYQIALERFMTQGAVHEDLRRTFALESHCYNPAYLWRRLEKSACFDFLATCRDGRKIA